MKNIPLPDLYYLENPDLKQLFRIMRISIFLLFFCLFSLMAENSHSQNARVTINRSDAPLESILNEIESQTDYLFIYKEDVNVKMRKTIQVNGKPVSEVLPILLTGSSIGYKMEGCKSSISQAEGLMEGPNVPNDYFFFSSLLAKRVNHCLRHLHLVEI